MEEKEIDWLWENKIAAGTISLFAGPQGLGKTFWSIYMASKITNGSPWPDGTPCQKGSVLFYYGEDDIAHTYKPRFRANNVDESKVRFFKSVEISKGDGTVIETSPTIMSDDIRAAIEQTNTDTGVPVRFVIIDPISNYWANTKENDNSSVRAALQPIQRLAEETGVAFLLISHLSKSVEQTSADNRVIGSTALTAVSRSVWILYPHEDKPGHIYFAPGKNNLAINPTAVEFCINKEADGRVDIVNANIPKSADDFEEQNRKNYKKTGRPPALFDAARGWLQQYLSTGPKPIGNRDNPKEGTVYADAKEAGYSPRTILRAKKELKVRSIIGKDSKYEWVLPHGSQDNETAMEDEEDTE